MSQKNLGDTLGGAAHYQPVEGRAFELVAGQAGKPLLDTEFNHSQEIQNEARANLIRKSIPSGFVSGRQLFDGRSVVGQLNFASTEYAPLTDRLAQTGDFLCLEPTLGNENKFLLINEQTAYVNGWEIPLVHANNDGTVGALPYSEVTLPQGPSTGGTSRYDLVYLEVWRMLIDGSSGPVKLHGGQEVDSSFDLPNQILDSIVADETTKRVQVQWAIRIKTNVNPILYPEGLDDGTVLAAGPGGTPIGGMIFENMVEEMGDPGLWRAGDGDPNNAFGTVDGYVYAIPICMVFRRNRAAYSQTTNLVGGPLIGSSITGTNRNRPDGLWADQVARQDILDIRHLASLPGHDWGELLEKNFEWLMDGTQRTRFALPSPGANDGTEVLIVDKFGPSAGASPMPAEPDGLTYKFSDKRFDDTLQFRVPSSDGSEGLRFGLAPSSTVTTTGVVSNNWVDGSKFEVQLKTGPNPALGQFITPNVVIYQRDSNTSFAPGRIVPSGMYSVVATPSTLEVTFNNTSDVSRGLLVKVTLTYPGGYGPNRSNAEERDIDLNWMPNDLVIGGTPSQGSGLGGGMSAINGAITLFGAGSGGASWYDGSYIEYARFSARGERAVEIGLKRNMIYSTSGRGYEDGADIRLPLEARVTDISQIEQIEVVSSPVRSTPEVVPAVYTLDADGWGVTIPKSALTPDLEPSERFSVTYKYEVVPLSEGASLSFGYPAVARQTMQLPNSLRVRPLKINPDLFVTSIGAGNIEGYPFSQPGDEIPVSLSSFMGEQDLNSLTDLEIDDFGTSVGFLKLEVRLPNPYVPIYVLGDPSVAAGVDAEGRWFYTRIKGSQWLDKSYDEDDPPVPLAFAQQLAAATIPHKTMLPVLCSLVEDTPGIGKRGSILMLVFTRFSTDERNEISYAVESGSERLTCVGVYRVTGRPLVLNRERF